MKSTSDVLRDMSDVLWTSSRYKKLGLLRDTYIIRDDAYVNGALKLLEVKSSAKAKPAFGVDLETTALDVMGPKAGVRLIQIASDTLVAVFDLFKLGKKSVNRIVKWLSDQTRVKIFHNSKFDLQFLMRHLKAGDVYPIFDTMLASQLLSLGDGFDRHNLGAVVKRYLGFEVDKDVDHSWGGELTERQLVYSSNDAAVLTDLRAEMIGRGREEGILKAFKLEFDAAQPTALMELNGVLLDQDRWMDLYRRNRAELMDVEDELFPMLNKKGGQLGLFDGVKEFNLNSNEDMKDALRGLGLELPTILDQDTGEETETTGMEKMAQIAGLHPVIGKVIKQRKLSKACSSYGKKFLRHVDPADGRMHADFKQIGTVTSRYSASDPPLHGIPKQSDHRTCLVAADGWELVWADYSQIELRILGELCLDEDFLKAFREGLDHHAYTASSIAKVPYEAITDIQRRRGKDLNFGVVYGVGDKRFAEKAGISLEEARKERGRYGEAYPNLDRYLKRAAAEARVNGFIRTLSGKKIRFKFDRKDKGQVAAVERHGKNYPIQGTSADITKRALRLLHKRLGEAGMHEFIKLIHCAHDEIVLEVMLGYIDVAGALLKSAMQDAAEEFLLEVPVVVDVEHNKYWKKRKED